MEANRGNDLVSMQDTPLYLTPESWQYEVLCANFSMTQDTLQRPTFPRTYLEFMTNKPIHNLNGRSRRIFEWRIVRLR